MNKPMTVAELIQELQTYPQDCVVIYDKYSERCLLESREISLVRACAPRSDGWVHDERPDQPTQLYVCFPGN